MKSTSRDRFPVINHSSRRFLLRHARLHGTRDYQSKYRSFVESIQSERFQGEISNYSQGLHYNQSVDWWSFGVLLYEMLIGQSPFSGCDEDELFWSICNEIPWYPHYLSKEALKCLQSLLEKDVTIRLGSIGSSEGDIKYHSFFADINWERLERREMEPPFKPQVVSSQFSNGRPRPCVRPKSYLPFVLAPSARHPIFRQPIHTWTSPSHAHRQKHSDQHESEAVRRVQLHEPERHSNVNIAFALFLISLLLSLSPIFSPTNQPCSIKVPINVPSTLSNHAH